MPSLWPAARTNGKRIGAGTNGSTRSAAVGPVTATEASGSSGDVESQGAYSRGDHVVITGTTISNTEPSEDDLDDDSGPDGIDTQMSVHTFLKIVSPHVRVRRYASW